MPKTRRKKGRRTKQAGVPYARGYHPPTAKQCLQAIGKSEGGNHFTAGDNFFPPIPAPTSIDDWLAQYNEEGQTYNQFITQCPWLSKRKWKYSKAEFNPGGKDIREKYPGAKLYLQPLGNFDAEEAPNFENLAEYARLFFCLPVEILPGVTIERENERTIYWIESAEMKSRVDKNAQRKSARSSKCRLEFRHEKGSGHLQLQCASVLSRLRQTLPDDALCLIGLTMFDLYDQDPDLFVAGLAAGNQRVGIFSFFRYNPTLSFSSEFWYGIERGSCRMKVAEQKQTILHRSCKLLVHEMCHLLGLDHCIWFSCLMNGSGHLHEDFRQPMSLCPVDLHKLQTLCGFDVVSRYAGLQHFYLRCGLQQEADWVARRLIFISE